MGTKIIKGLGAIQAVLRDMPWLWAIRKQWQKESRVQIDNEPNAWTKFQKKLVQELWFHCYSVNRGEWVEKNNRTLSFIDVVIQQYISSHPRQVMHVVLVIPIMLSNGKTTIFDEKMVVFRDFKKGFF